MSLATKAFIAFVVAGTALNVYFLYRVATDPQHTLSL